MTRDELKYKWMMAQIEPELFYLPFRNKHNKFWFNFSEHFRGDDGNRNCWAGGQCFLQASIYYNNGNNYINLRSSQSKRSIYIDDFLIANTSVYPTRTDTQNFDLSAEFMKQLSKISNDVYIVCRYTHNGDRVPAFGERNIQAEIETVNAQITIAEKTYHYPDIITDKNLSGKSYGMHWNVWINPRTGEIREFAEYSVSHADGSFEQVLFPEESRIGHDYVMTWIFDGRYDNNFDSHLLGTISKGR